jgi:hypothetical protein
MRRRLLLLAGLSCAVAIAVLLRTGVVDVEPVVSAGPAESDAAAIAEVSVGDCTITSDLGPGLAGSEAAQPLPSVPLDAENQILVAASDSPNETPARYLDFERPRRLHPLIRVTIRPPPRSHVA